MREDRVLSESQGRLNHLQQPLQASSSPTQNGLATWVLIHPTTFFHPATPPSLHLCLGLVCYFGLNSCNLGLPPVPCACCLPCRVQPGAHAAGATGHRGPSAPHAAAVRGIQQTHKTERPHKTHRQTECTPTTTTGEREEVSERGKDGVNKKTRGQEEHVERRDEGEKAEGERGGERGGGRVAAWLLNGRNASHPITGHPSPAITHNVSIK